MIKTYDKVIKSIEDTNPLAIILVGSSVEDITNSSDIDLFVICDRFDGFVRDIKVHEGIEFDINYLGMDILRDLIDDRTTFILTAFKRYRPIKINQEIEDLLIHCNEVYNSGPIALGQEEIDYLRFNYGMRLKDINKNILNLYEFNILSSNTLDKILEDYFRINRLWVPKTKKILRKIKEVDNRFYILVTSYLQIEEPIIKLEYLEQILSMVFKNYGGLKYTWENKKFPII